jgi:succinate dehydrogenase/fumarate reductase flavoprotein subunit
LLSLNLETLNQISTFPVCHRQKKTIKNESDFIVKRFWKVPKKNQNTRMKKQKQEEEMRKALKEVEEARKQLEKLQELHQQAQQEVVKAKESVK